MRPMVVIMTVDWMDKRDRKTARQEGIGFAWTDTEKETWLKGSPVSR